MVNWFYYGNVWSNKKLEQVGTVEAGKCVYCQLEGVEVLKDRNTPESN